MSYTPPTQDEIERVAAYWERVKQITCQHKSGFTVSGSTDQMCCSDCGNALNFLTDVQIEELRARPMKDSVRDNLLLQMERGGVRFAIDGEWHDIRFHAHRLPGWAGDDESKEYACMSVENVALLLQATESR